MTRRNRQGREVWFDRWFWSYMPCHWKGWVLIASVAMLVSAAVWALIVMLHPQDGDPRPFLVLPVGFVVLRVLAERHSTSKPR
jgi:hypothetical protein